MGKAREIIREVADLYSYATDKKTAEEMADFNFEKLIVREKEWDEAFENYELDDVLDAIRKYWRFGNDKSRPSVKQILGMLKTEKEVRQTSVKSLPIPKGVCVEKEWIDRDIRLGRFRHMTTVYHYAVKLAMNDILIEKIGASEWSRKSEYERYELCLANGLFSDELLVKVCLDRWGKEYNWGSANMTGDGNAEDSVKHLASHWRMN